MSTDNRLNTGKGRLFQEWAAHILATHFGVELRLDFPLPIGNPPKEHKFDLVSADQNFVGECKNYSWTTGGNVPSAKMGFINEAVFYLSFLPPETTRFVAMRKDSRPTTGESLVDYYHRTYRHLLNAVSIIEIESDSGILREIRNP